MTLARRPDLSVATPTMPGDGAAHAVRALVGLARLLGRQAARDELRAGPLTTSRAMAATRQTDASSHDP